MSTTFVLGRDGRTPNEPKMICECGCEWFSQETFFQYKGDHNIVLGGKVPRAGLNEYILYRCAKCGKLARPSITPTGANANHLKAYEKFLENIGVKSEDNK